MAKAPRGERLILGIFGDRNAGKSSLINALTGQQIAIVSDEPGTTTDPVSRHYELLPLGPVTFYDTAGIDDVGNLGELRVRSTRKVLFRADIALVVIGENGITPSIERLIGQIRDMRIPALVVFNKTDIHTPSPGGAHWCEDHDIRHLRVSSKTGEGIDRLKDTLVSMAPPELSSERVLIGDIIRGGDTVVLVVPIDLAAPKGRLILPQVQVIREVLDNDGIALTVKERELEHALSGLASPPALVVTDSQVVLKVAGDVPDEVPFTTFSTVFARYKGDLDAYIAGARAVDRLKSGDRVAIAEACAHHVQADDIGRVKIPRWLRQFTGMQLEFDVVSGHDFPEDLESYALVIHCGGCMLNRAEVIRRIRECTRRGVPITNYGVVISRLHGLLDRVIAPFYRSG